MKKKDAAFGVIQAKYLLRASQFNAKYGNLKTTLSQSSGEGWKNDTRQGAGVSEMLCARRVAITVS